MILYKVINKNGMAKDRGIFDYKKYFPKGDKSGKWTPKVKPDLCLKGYHVTPYWNMWLSDKSDLIFEVEVEGLVKNDSVGVVDKFVCKRLRLVKQITPKFDSKKNCGDLNTGNNNSGNLNTGFRNAGDLNTGYSNAGDLNTGYSNSGNRNSGNRNSGNRNSGNRNSGDLNTGYSNSGDFNTGFRNAGDSNSGNRNSGDLNTGDHNTGDSNSGYSNSGDRNSGVLNTGDHNTGDWNSGDRNTGYSNSGDRNSGVLNTGDHNTGDWNSGDRNTGCFNTKKPDYYELFNKPICKEEYDKIIFPEWLYFEVDKDYKESFKKAFVKASKKDIVSTVNLPNFDYGVFKEISGITKSMIDKKVKR